MNKAVREALQQEAQKERRSLSSLLDKVIMDYLAKINIVPREGFPGDQRRYPRSRVNLPARATVANGSGATAYPCVVLDLALGGVLVAYPKGSGIHMVADGKLPSFELSFELPQTEELLRFHCRARHITENNGGLQVGATFDEPAEEALTKLQAYLN